VPRAESRRRQRRHRIDAGEATALRAALVRMAEAHRRTLDQLSSGVAVFDAQRRLAFYNDSYRRLWIWTARFSTANPTIRACSIGCAPRAKFRNSRISGPGGKAARGLSRRRPEKDTGIARRRAVSVVTTGRIRKAG